jgi:LysM repeat protein
MAPQPPKAFIEVMTTHAHINCQYNPEKIKIKRSNSWDTLEMPGKGVKTAIFKGSQPGDFEIEDLIFDTTDSGDPVTTTTDKLLALLDRDPQVQGTSELTNNARPPTVKFHWGQMVSFECYVESVDVEFTYFSSKGVPLRAEVGISLKQFKEDQTRRQNPTSGTPYPHKVHRMLPGETLDRISSHYYGDPNQWRALASANGIEDPLSVRPGSLLVIPEITTL